MDKGIGPQALPMLVDDSIKMDRAKIKAETKEHGHSSCKIAGDRLSYWSS